MSNEVVDKYIYDNSFFLVTCHLSPVTCHLSPVTCHSQLYLTGAVFLDVNQISIKFAVGPTTNNA
jgi:hypothetical protein